MAGTSWIEQEFHSKNSGVLNQTGGVNIDKLKKVMSESLPEKVLKDIDSRSATRAPWQILILILILVMKRGSARHPKTHFRDIQKSILVKP